MTDLLSPIIAGQSPTGAFLSTVNIRGRSYPDWNSFTTAQVLRALNGAVESTDLATLRERALNFLLRCESPVLPGAFSFWPKGFHPSWIYELPEDADDTAVIGIELARQGCLDRKTLCKIACKVLVSHRLRRIHSPAPPWLRPGVFLTWLRQGPRPNVVDCCVNANVAAFLAYAGLQHLPGFQEACEMIEAGIRWAGSSWSRARSLVPFYPHPIELFYAVAHAVQCGAEPLAMSLDLMHGLEWATEEKDTLRDDRPICGSAYGHIIWTSSVLQTARKIVGRQNESK